MCLVDHAHARACLTTVDQPTPDRALEEPRTPVAGQDPVVLARAGVTANHAVQVGSGPSGRRSGATRVWPFRAALAIGDAFALMIRDGAG